MAARVGPRASEEHCPPSAKKLPAPPRGQVAKTGRGSPTVGGLGATGTGTRNTAGTGPGVRSLRIYVDVLLSPSSVRNTHSPLRGSGFVVPGTCVPPGAARLPSSLQPLVLPWGGPCGPGSVSSLLVLRFKTPRDFTSSPTRQGREPVPVREDRRSRGAAHWPPPACAWSPHSGKEEARAPHLETAHV